MKNYNLISERNEELTQRINSYAMSLSDEMWTICSILLGPVKGSSQITEQDERRLMTAESCNGQIEKHI